MQILNKIKNAATKYRQQINKYRFFAGVLLYVLAAMATQLPDFVHVLAIMFSIYAVNFIKK